MSVLSPVHNGYYSRRIQRMSPKTATVAKFGDKLSPFPATIVAIVDRALMSVFSAVSYATTSCIVLAVAHNLGIV